MHFDGLRTYRAAHPQCVLLMLSDLRSGTVLAADGALAYPQENLDALSALTRDAFDMAGLATDYVALQTPQATRIFKKVPQLGSVALTCVCNPYADIAELLAGMHRFAGSMEIPEIAA